MYPNQTHGYGPSCYNQSYPMQMDYSHPVRKDYNQTVKRPEYVPPLIQTTQGPSRMMMMKEMPSLMTPQAMTYMPKPQQYNMPKQSSVTQVKHQHQMPSGSYTNHHISDSSNRYVTNTLARFDFQGSEAKHLGQQGNIETPQRTPDKVKFTGKVTMNEPNAVRNIRVKQTKPTNTLNDSNGNLNVKFFGNTEREKMFIFTGTVERVIKWNKIFKNHFCYFEVIAVWKGIEKGKIKSQHIILLKDRNAGPILQVVYYDITPCTVVAEDFGQMLRCVGNMIGPNILNAVSIRTASAAEVDNLRRLSLICDQAVAHYLAV